MQSKKSLQLADGLKGFLVTCDPNCEKRAIKECFNLFNQAVEALYPDFDKNKLLGKR